MKALIVESPGSQAGAMPLLDQILSVDEKTNVVGVLSGIAEAVRYFHTQRQPDLLFLDIPENDPNPFRLFQEAAVACPVVYLLHAQQQNASPPLPNCIDVLLKPLAPAQLAKCLRHYRELQDFFIQNHSSLFEHFNGKEKLKSRILIKKGSEYQTFRVSDVVYFFSDHKLVFLVDSQNRKYLAAVGSLSELLNQLDRNMFYRANRKFIVNVNHIQVFSMANSSRIRLKLSLPVSEPIIISQQNTALFKQWIGEKL